RGEHDQERHRGSLRSRGARLHGRQCSRRARPRPIVRRYDAAAAACSLVLSPRGKRPRAPRIPGDHMKPAHIRATTLSLAIVVALAAPAMYAQEAEADQAPSARSATELDTVTVTARRRTESIMDVPVAVSAFGEEQLKDLQASDVSGLQVAVPNLNIVQGRGSANSTNVFIRGIGQPDALQSFDPGVGMYVDDVYYSRINGSMFSLFDVQQIEVLRGPQGTLYGKNSTGGAIKVTTRNPFD